MQSQVKTVNPPANVIVLVPSKHDGNTCIHQWQAKAYHYLRRLNFIGITSSLPVDNPNHAGQNICPTKSVIYLKWSEADNKGWLITLGRNGRCIYSPDVNSLHELCAITAGVYKDDSHAATLAYERHHLNLRQ